MSPWGRFYLTLNDYICQFYALFIHLIIEDVLPGDSKAIGIIGALLNISYPELYSPEKKKTTTAMTTTEKIWPGHEEKHELFCSLEGNSLNTGTKHLNERLCLLVR